MPKHWVVLQVIGEFRLLCIHQKRLTAFKSERGPLGALRTVSINSIHYINPSNKPMVIFAVAIVVLVVIVVVLVEAVLTTQPLPSQRLVVCRLKLVGRKRKCRRGRNWLLLKVRELTTGRTLLELQQLNIGLLLNQHRPQPSRCPNQPASVVSK